MALMVCINYEVPNWVDAHEIQVKNFNQLAELLAPSVILMGNPSFRFISSDFPTP
jgi:hypothetical protein